MIFRYGQTDDPCLGRRTRLTLAAALTIAFCALGGALQAQEPISGESSACTDFKVELLDLGFVEWDKDIADEGWIWLQTADPSLPRLRSVAGLVHRSKVAHNDTPANHDSHDQNTDILVDPGLEDILSQANKDVDGDGVADSIEIEWEIGTLPSEKSGDGADPRFARWAWPSVGDRFWAEGHWILDCGHLKTVNGVEQAPSEIHPPRAVASMRNLARPLPGTGSTPVPVTATDLLIHGEGGFVVEQLNCGMDIILSGGGCPVTTTPIDEVFELDICLPRRTSDAAFLTWTVSSGPGNTVSAPIDIFEAPASPACENASEPMDMETMLHVVVDLTGTGTTASDVFARRIDAGWVSPPAEPLRRFTVELEQMDNHDDHDPAPFSDGEMSFFWLNIDRVREPWFRLVDFEIPTSDGCAGTNHMNDYDDSGGCGHGELNFAGPAVDFYVRTGQPYSLHTTGFEQDCYDSFYGLHFFTTAMYIACHAQVDSHGNNDRILPLDATFGPLQGYGVGFQDVPELEDNDYELELQVSEIPLSNEDTANLQITKTCSYEGDAPVVGEPFTCSLVARNLGPGLPRDVLIEDFLLAEDVSGWVIETPVVVVEPGELPGSVTELCEVFQPDYFRCALHTLPVGGTATIVATLTPGAPGDFRNRAEIGTASVDPNPFDDRDSYGGIVYLPAEIDVDPGSEANLVPMTGTSIVEVLIEGTPLLDAATILPSSVCFGHAADPGSRDCTAAAPSVMDDLDGDGDGDLLLAFEVAETGLTIGHTEACLTGRTSSGAYLFGCDRVTMIVF